MRTILLFRVFTDLFQTRNVISFVCKVHHTACHHFSESDFLFIECSECERMESSRSRTVSRTVPLLSAHIMCASFFCSMTQHSDAIQQRSDTKVNGTTIPLLLKYSFHGLRISSNIEARWCYRSEVGRSSVTV